MKKWIGFIVLALIICTSCGPKPYYKTAEGKRKLEHYNKIQYGERIKY